MPIRFRCHHCDHRLTARTAQAGGTMRCPNCQKEASVPTPSHIQRANQQREREKERERQRDQNLEKKTQTERGRIPAESREGSGGSDPFAEFAVFDTERELVYQTADFPLEAPPRAVDYDKVAVSRTILYVQGALLGGVALLFFVLGIMVGSRAASKPDGPRGPQACVVTGQVAYQSRDQRTLADEGAVVILLPRDAEPDLKAPVVGLRPGESAPLPNDTGLTAIQQIGGGFARVDAQGRFRVRLPDAGRYYLLLVSRHARRSSDRQLRNSDLAAMGRYLIPPTELLGDQQYQWNEVTISRDRQFEFTFRL